MAARVTALASIARVTLSAMPIPSRRRMQTLFVALLWGAFVARGALHALMQPMWDGFDEPFHLAYVAFVAEHGRPPGFEEPSFPALYVESNRFLPSSVKHGAPSFADWRAMPESERMARRQQLHAATVSQRPEQRRRYASPNYERQQGPLFYYLAAPLYRLVRHLALNEQLIALRLFCVLLASLAVPFSARLLRLVGGERAVWAGLPLVALAPNTLFFVDRITDDALTFALMPLVCIFAVAFARGRTKRRDEHCGGWLTAAGVWTKLTFVPALAGVGAAAMLRARRDRRAGPLVRAAAVPVVALSVLLVWTHAASGSWTGLAESTARARIGSSEWRHGVATVMSADWWRRLLSLHFWSGGWGFAQPESATYAFVLSCGALIALLLSAAVVRDPSARRSLRRCAPLAAILLTFLGAMIQHGVAGAIAAAQLPGFPEIGAEGWYLDLLRPIEASLFAVGVLAMFRRHSGIVGAIAAITLAGCDLTLSATVLWPSWAAMQPAFAAFRAALSASAIELSFGLALALLAGWLALVAAAATIAVRRARQTPN